LKKEVKIDSFDAGNGGLGARAYESPALPLSYLANCEKYSIMHTGRCKEKTEGYSFFSILFRLCNQTHRSSNGIGLAMA